MKYTIWDMKVSRARAILEMFDGNQEKAFAFAGQQDEIISLTQWREAIVTFQKKPIGVRSQT